MDNTAKKNNLLIAANTLRSFGRIESSHALKRYASSLRLNTTSELPSDAGSLRFGVSVILPTYKGASRISRALDSLLAQTEDREKFEIIIVLNGPMDGTSEVVEEYQRHHKDLQIVLLKTEIAGASHARNYGLCHANYAYCTYLDDDDYISPNYIRVLLKHAHPDRLVFAKIIDFDESGQWPSPISEQVRIAVEAERTNVITRPFDVRGILSMTCAKLAPTSCLLSVNFDVDLHSGEDVVFWSEVVVKHHLEYYVPEEIDEAMYYREVRQGSVSRRTSEFSFSVTERLQVISRAQEIEGLETVSEIPSKKEFLRSRYAGQIGFITRYLKEHKDRYGDFLLECKRLGIRDDIIKMVNDSLADTLVISYCFPPFNDTSAIVMMKRIIGWQWPVRVISNDMTGTRAQNPQLANIISPHLASHVELKTPVAFSHERAIREFAEQALKNYQAIPKPCSPSKIYSRAMWPASSFAAALIKIANHQIKWTAEFSDPLVLDIHGQERKGDVPAGWLTSLGLQEAIQKLAPDLAETNQLFRLAELLPYILADEIVFTNEGQRHYMLSQSWMQAVRERAMSVSTILPHPTLPAEYYSVGTSSIEVDKGTLNIGFFGSFYATRGLKEVLLAMRRATTLGSSKIALHVVSADASALIQEVDELGIADLVEVHPSLPYFDCLASFSCMDYLLINDAVTAGIKPLNPYLPSKLSDYLGAEKPIWALVEFGSSLSKAQLPPGSLTSILGDEEGYVEALLAMLTTKASEQPNYKVTHS